MNTPAHIQKMIGKQYGYIFVTGAGGYRKRKGGKNLRLASYKCICGADGETEPASIRRGGAKSCGCMRGKMIKLKDRGRKKHDLTHEQLKTLVHYDPATGVFSGFDRKRNRGGCGGKDVNGNGYLRVSIDGKRFMAHRLAFLYMTGEWPENEVDHINGVRDDNRWCNLRAATRSENMRNTKLRSTNMSGHHGVYMTGPTKRWTASINGVFLGRYDSKGDAIKARKQAEREHGYHENHGRIA